MNPIQPRWLSKADAARYIGKSPDVVQRLTATGVLVPRYLDSRPSYDVRDLDELMENAPTDAPSAKKKTGARTA